MFKTPKECYDYIVKNELETAVIGAMMQQTDNYSIAEIADARFLISYFTVQMKDTEF